MISLTSTAHGSLVRRHGRSLRVPSDHASKVVPTWGVVLLVAVLLVAVLLVAVLFVAVLFVAVLFVTVLFVTVRVSLP